MFKNFRFHHIHPLIISLYPASALLVSNYGYVALGSIIRPLVFSLAFTLAVYLAVRLVVRGWDKASIITTILVLVFFNFGHLYDLLKPVTLLNIEIGRLRYLLPLTLVISAGLIILVLTKGRNLRQWNGYLTLFSIALVILAAGQLAWLTITSSGRNDSSRLAETQPAVSGAEFSGVKRDVYYIILDKYTRDDYLLKDYGLDVSDFIGQLEELGFYVAKCSQSNYPGTALSMASSLNYEYLDELAPEVIENNLSWVHFKPYIDHSRARQFFTDLGYKFVTAETGYEWVEITSADIMIKRERVGGGLELTSFETLFLKSTLLRALMGVDLPVNFTEIVSFEKSHYNRILFTLDQAKNIPEIPGNTFTYLHLVVPHEPYVFTPDGEYKTDQDDASGYQDNIRFINNQMIPLLEEIIQKSEVPPVIVLQADHGNQGEDAYAIFNAYYLPDGGADQLYPSITPVNSFRLILDGYFNTDLGLLEDVTYTWVWEDVYDFGILPNQCER